MRTKNIIIGVIAGVMVIGAAVPASAKISFNYNSSATETNVETTIVEDSMGNTYEMTHTIEIVDGDTTEYFDQVPFEMYNDTENEIVGFYMSNSDDDSWGDNWLDYFGEGTVLQSGAHAYGLSIHYNSANPEVDMKIAMADGTDATLNNFDVMNFSGLKHIDFVVEEGEEAGSYMFYFE